MKARRRPYVHRTSERYVVEVLLEDDWHERSHVDEEPLDLCQATEQARLLDGRPFPTRVVMIRTTQVECRTIWEHDRVPRPRKASRSS